MNEIKFYKVSDAYGYLSNFAPYQILLSAQVWKTVEHFFQANKFEDEAVRSKIQKLDSPMEAAKEGRNRNNILTPDWDSIRDSVMKKALLCKFKQHPNLRKELILTGDAVLIEHTVNDNYWADGGDGTGKNRLGEILMDVRNEVRNICEDPNVVIPPWIAFPSVSTYDLFWRMGWGEGYIDDWYRYYNQTDKVAYQNLFPKHEEWTGFYEDDDQN